MAINVFAVFGVGRRVGESARLYRRHFATGTHQRGTFMAQLLLFSSRRLNAAFLTVEGYLLSLAIE